MTPRPIVRPPARGGQAKPVTHKPTPPPRGGRAVPTQPQAGGLAGPAVPVMPSVNEIRAKANADAWKSIQQMIGALPTDQAIQSQYGAQAAAIQPLVQAHRDWLETAGQYHQQTASALGNMVQGAFQNQDTQQAGLNAGAGMAAGAGFSGNVSPAAAGQPAAYGSNFGAYLSALLPYATAQGIGNTQAIYDKQNAALTDVRSQRAQIAAGLPDLQTSGFTSAYDQAFEQYKSELAALTPLTGANALVGPDGLTADQRARNAETARHNRASEGAADTRASAAVTSANRPRATSTTAAKNTSTGQTPAEVKNLTLALTRAWNDYNKPTGTSVPSLYTGTITLKYPKIAGQPSTKADEVHSETGKTEAEVKAKLFRYRGAHQHPAAGPTPAALWQQGPIHPVQNSPRHREGQTGEYTRRMNAWRELAATNAALAHPLPTAALQKLFRTRFGQPKA